MHRYGGSLCLFRTGDVLGGTREGKIVLVRSSGLTDPDTGSSIEEYSRTRSMPVSNRSTE